MANYTTIQGDMWDQIAYKLYNDDKAVNVLLEANQEYRNISIFSAGVSLEVPDYVKPVTNDLPPWRR